MKLGVRYYFDPAIRGMTDDLADAAEVMFTRGIARAGEVGRAGFIPEQDVPLLTRRRRYAAVVKMLTDSGLWKTVPGGYQVRRWSDWQEHLDALTRKRTADRERQRARRAANREHSPPPTTSRDTSRDVAAVEGEGDLELGVQQGGKANGTRLSTAAPPPVENGNSNGSRPSRYCTKHPTGTDGNCGPCKDARLTAEAWERDHATTKAQRQRQAKRCPRHPTEPADHCAPCRSERLARTETP